ncbi:tRNA lysidine(34) synthetase TilS [Legionella sp. km772]|nr:tRNA lysidine(34) synthetase TilS [Legionella sp. km772]
MDAIHLLSTQWLERLVEFEQLIVAFSGGLDSTVLLSCLASYPFLHSRLLAIHINHGISPNALAWQKHCEAFCSRLNVSFLTESIKFNRSSNIEEEARTARYAAFARILNQKSCLLLGHHMDDQAETVLLQLFRGTGIDGLAGIPAYENFASGTMARPLLQHTREQLHHYAQVAQLTWVDDESNQDSRFSRNYLRNQIMPLLREKWPGVVGNINRTAVHCQQGKKNLYQLALIDCQELEHPGKSLLIEPLKHLGEARIINVLRVWLKKNKIKLPTTAVMSRIVHELLEASVDATPLVAWNDTCIRRYQERIYLDNKRLHPLPECIEWSAFPQSLALNDESILFAKAAKEGLIIPPKAKITIRFRQGGETIVLHQQTKKLKKLFQEWQVPVWHRDRIPLLYINEQLAAVVGYVVSDSFFSSTEPAWIINF